MSPGNPRFLDTIVCDDIRQELGNKMSIMGVYGPALVVPGFPVLMPRLCFVMKARTSRDRPFERLNFLVSRDDEVIVQAELDSEQLAEMAKRVPASLPGEESPDPAEGAITVSMVMMTSPMAFEKPCRLRFRATTESEELRGGSLIVISAG